MLRTNEKSLYLDLSECVCESLLLSIGAKMLCVCVCYLTVICQQNVCSQTTDLFYTFTHLTF